MITSLDTETFLMFPGCMAPPMVCTSWARGGSSGVIHHADPDLTHFLVEAFAGHTVFANAPYDLAVFIERFPELKSVIFEALDAGRVHDIQMREKLIDLALGKFRFEEDEEGKIKAKGYSLFDITKRRLGVILEKDDWRLRYHDVWDLPIGDWPEGALKYAADDAINTLRIFEKQEVAGEILDDEAAQVRAHWALHLMTLRGFRTDGAAVEELRERVTREIGEVRDQLVESGLVRPNGTRDTKAAMQRMVEIMGIECVITKKGQELIDTGQKTAHQIITEAPETGKYVSLSEEATTYSNDPLLKDYTRYSKKQSLLTGSVKHLAQGTVIPIQSRFQPLMETGRTSSSGPNIQNLRREPGVRECFIPRQGYYLIACDYSSAELHTLAQVCFAEFGESALKEALNSGRDVHLWLGAMLAGLDYETALELYQAEDEHTSSMRQTAKAGNFGFPGGLSARRFVGYAAGMGVDIDERESKRLRALWFTAWPEMRRYFDWVASKRDDRGKHYVEQYGSGRLRSNCTFTAAANSPFQGLAADAGKAACYEVARRQHCEPGSALWGSHTLAFIHDELIIEAPIETCHESAMELQSVMETVFARHVPDCPTKAEPTIMKYWCKKAKQRWKNDKLIAWPTAADLA